MAKLKTDYDDAAATAERKFAPQYGVFNATIKEVLPTKDEFKIKTSSNNQPFYTARYIFAYKDADGKERTKSLLLNPGLWFPKEMAQLLKATKSDNPEGRKALMADTDALVGATIKIAVGAREKTWGDSEEFEGFEVGEFTNDDNRLVKFIRNEIIGLGSDAKIDEKFESELRERFKKGDGKYADLVDEVGFDDDKTEATDKDLEF